MGTNRFSETNLRRREEGLDSGMRLIKDIFDPEAQRLLEDPAVIERVRDWLRNRLHEFGDIRIGNDYLQVRLNPWNESHGLGLQRASVRVLRDKSTGGACDVLLPDEWKSPTIGIVAPGLVKGDDVSMAEAQFGIDAGNAEECISMSDGFQMDGTKEGEVSRLKVGEKLLVSGPDAVRTYIQVRNASPDKIREAVNAGVYACRFVRKASVN